MMDKGKPSRGLYRSGRKTVNPAHGFTLGRISLFVLVLRKIADRTSHRKVYRSAPLYLFDKLEFSDSATLLVG